MANERRFAGITVTIGSDAVGVITTYSDTSDITLEDVSGSGDTVGDPPIIQQKRIPVELVEDLSFGGVSVDSDAGQSAVNTAARTGAEVTVEFRYSEGDGYDLKGYFSNVTEEASKPNVFRFTADFAVNDRTSVAAPV